MALNWDYHLKDRVKVGASSFTVHELAKKKQQNVCYGNPCTADGTLFALSQACMQKTHLSMHEPLWSIITVLLADSY